MKKKRKYGNRYDGLSNATGYLTLQGAPYATNNNQYLQPLAAPAIQPLQTQGFQMPASLPVISQDQLKAYQDSLKSPDMFQKAGNSMSNAWNGLDTAGKVGAVTGMAQGAISLGTQIAGNLSVPEIQQQDFTSNTKGDLLNRAENFKGYDAGRTDNLGSAASGALTGASAGAALGPVGAGIGAVIGGLAGGISSIFGNKKKKKAEERANKIAVGAMNAQNTLINRNSISQSLAQEYAYGGDFNNGVTSFNNGGTHEENPYGGIFQGMGANGEPNLVEEGEVKWNNYIFSNRLEVPENIKSFNLPDSLKKKTYADSAEYLQKESKERELDPISKRGLNTNLVRLASSQETLKQEQDMNKFAQGGDIHIDPSKRGTFKAQAIRMNMGVQEAASKILNAPEGEYSPAMRKKANFAKNFAHAYGGIMWGEGGMIRNGRNNDQDSDIAVRNTNLFALGGNMYDGNSQSNQQMDIKNTPTFDSKNYKDEEIMNYLKQKFGDKWQDALEIITLEGGYNPKTGKFITNQRQRNTMKSGKQNTDRGIFQISNVYHGNVSDNDADNPYKAIDYAYNLSKQGTDWSQWVSAKKRKGSSQNFNYEGIPSTANTPLTPPATTPVVPGFTQADVDKVILAINKQLDEKEAQKQAQKQEALKAESGKTNYLRYAPLATNLGLLASSISSSPDRLNLGRIAPQVLGEKMRYNPIDSEYVAGQIRQQAAATNRQLVDTSAGNRSIAQSALLASNRQSQDAIGNALFQANQMNDEKLQRVKAFNRDTDMFNIGNDFKAQTYNTNALNQERIWNKQADASRRNEIRQGFATIGNTLGQIGTENRWMKIAPVLGGGYGSTGDYGVTEKGLFGDIFKEGGKMKVYKKKIK